MAGGWAVGGTGRFSRGWLPASSGSSRRPGMFGTPVQLSLLKPYAGEEGMEGGAAGRLDGWRPGRVLGCDHERAVPSWMVTASCTGKPLPGGQCMPSSRAGAPSAVMAWPVCGDRRPVAECAVTGRGDARSWRIGCRPVCRCTIAWSVGLAACSAGSGRAVPRLIRSGQHLLSNKQQM